MLVEVMMPPSGTLSPLNQQSEYFKHASRRCPNRLHYQIDLLFFVLAWEDRVTNVQFGDDAGERPDIYLKVIWNSQDYLRCAVVSGLDVSIDSIAEEAARAEVNYLETRFIGLS